MSTDTEEVAGRIVAVGQDVIVLQTPTGRRVNVTDNRIRRIWKVEGGTEKGAILGLLIGALPAGLTQFASACQDCGGTYAKSWAIEGSAVVIGAWLGHRHSREVVIYEAPVAARQ